MRPPEPRREAARYIQYLTSAQELFKAQALDAAADGSLTRAELEAAWSSATVGAKSFLEHVALRVGNDNALYWKRLAKGRAVPPPAGAAQSRKAWVQYNLELIASIGADQIDELLNARTDAKDGLTPAQRAELLRLHTGSRHVGHNAVTLVQRALEKKGLIREGLRGTELTEAGRAAAQGFAGASAAALPPVDAARARNVNLIGGQTEAQRRRLTELFKSAQAKGERHETLVERVQRITGAGHKRAKLIARDQTVKHNAAVQQETARTLGVSQYIWRTSGDEAVRPYHKKLNGKTFSYADPPVTDAYGHRNNPGEDYNCRCQAEVIVDLFAGLAGPDLSGSLRAQGKLGKKPVRGR